MLTSLGTVECAATITNSVYARWSGDTGSGRFLGIPSRNDWVCMMSECPADVDMDYWDLLCYEIYTNA